MIKYTFLWIIGFLCLINQTSRSQQIGDLKGIYYQAVAIDENGKEIVGMDINGKPLYEKAIGVRFTITKGLNGPVEWEETHTITTDKYGLFSLVIGSGISTGNGIYTRMLDIPWIDADQFLKVEIATKNDGNYKLVSNQQFMAVPYSFYTDDIADDAVTTSKLLDSTILNRDLHTASVDTRTVLDRTLLNEDLATSAIDTRTLLDSTILNQDLRTSAVDSRIIANETILTEDLATGSVNSRTLLDSSIVNSDLAKDAIDSRTILDGAIIAADLDTGAINTTGILDGTILNEDLSDSTIDLTTKVTGILPVINGGTGGSVQATDHMLVGNGTNPVRAKALVSADTSIQITQTPDSIILKAKFAATPLPTSADGGTFVIGNLANGSTYVSNAINSFAVSFGDIVIASCSANLQGCMLTAYVSQPNVVRVAIFNGTGSAVNLGTVTFRVYIVK